VEQAIRRAGGGSRRRLRGSSAHRSASRRPLSVDATGGLLAVVGLGGLIYALTEAPASGWTSGPVLVTGLVGLAALAALVPVEQRRRLPMLHTDLFRSRTFDAINVATLVFYGALAAAGYLVVQPSSRSCSASEDRPTWPLRWRPTTGPRCW
jgi:hypothetical protein